MDRVKPNKIFRVQMDLHGQVQYLILKIVDTRPDPYI